MIEPIKMTAAQCDAHLLIQKWRPRPVPVWNLRTNPERGYVNARAAASLVSKGMAQYTRTFHGDRAVIPASVRPDEPDASLAADSGAGGMVEA